MGVYLSKPITEKVSSDVENARLKCGASSMQGWRSNQEDAHSCCLDFDKEISLFAVYDGHGGSEVAEYASKHLPDYIRKNPAYDEGNYEKALQEAFLEFDATLITEPVIATLKTIADMKSKEDETPEEGEEGAEDVSELREEANMPLEEVIAKYKLKGLPKTPAAQRLCGESTPVSPFLRARPSSSGSDGTSAGDAEVSSSSAAITNGVGETNGDVHEHNEVKPSEATDSNVSSSQNGEISDRDKASDGEEKTTDNSTEGVVKPTENNDVTEEAGDDTEKTPVALKNGKGRIAKKKAAVTMFQSLLEDTSDSDSDNDESFQANDTSVVSSDEDENEEAEGEEAAEDEEEAEDEEADEEDEDDDEEEDDECDLTDDLKRTEEPGYDSGCTAVVALIVKDKLYVANAGDSRAVLCRGGKAVEMSIDHKPEDSPEKERIIEAGGKITQDGRVNGGLNLSRALGDHTYKKTPDLDATKQMITALPDVKVETINPELDEFVVLACDGIWNSMNSQEVVDYIRPQVLEGARLSSICEKLFDSCLAEGSYGDGTGCDNMTCVIVRFQSGNKRPASPNESMENKKAKLEEGEK